MISGLKCAWKPRVKGPIKNEDNNSYTYVDEESLLWKDVYKFVGGSSLRELAKDIYALLKTRFVDDFLLGAERDRLGEVVFKSVVDKYNFSKLISDKLVLQHLLARYGIQDDDGNTLSYENTLEAIDNANSFNKNCLTQQAVPVIRNGKVTFDVKPCGYGMNYIKALIAFSSDLNKGILEFLNKLGFQISFSDLSNLKFNGLFMPENALRLEDGLIDIIRIANNEEGYKDIPEEFAHLLILGLSHTSLVRNMIASLLRHTNGRYEAILLILGDSFDTYKNMYSDDEFNVDWDLMAREAAGKLLVDALNNNDNQSTYKSYNDVTVAPKTFIDRILNFIFQIFKKTEELIVKDIVKDARARTNYIADLFKNNRKSLFEEIKMNGIQDILNSKDMYFATLTISDIDKVLLDGANLARKVYYRDRNKMLNNGDFSMFESLNTTTVNSLKTAYEEFKNDRLNRTKYNNLKELVDASLRDRWLKIENMKDISAGSSIQNTLSDLIGSLNDSVNALIVSLKDAHKDLEGNDLPTLELIRRVAEITNYLGKCINAFLEFGSKVGKLKSSEIYKDPLISDPRVTPEAFRKKIDNMIKDANYQIGGIVLTMKNEYDLKSEEILIALVKGYLPNGVHYKTVDGKNVDIDPTEIVKHANATLSMSDRLIKGMSLCSDFLLNILSDIYSELKNLERLKLVSLELGIRSMLLRLELHGHDSRFMFEIGSDGVKTGRYISNYNFEKWYLDRQKVIERLKNSNISNYLLKEMLRDWDAIHSEIINPADPTSLVPNLNYKVNGVAVYNTHKLDSLTLDLREYYDQFMEYKLRMDRMYPAATTHLYTCIQIRKTEDLKTIDLLKNPNASQFLRDRYESMTDWLTIKEDDSDVVIGLTVWLDIDGKPIRRSPIKFTGTLDSVFKMSKLRRSQITEDCSNALLAYSGAAENYSTCNNLINQYIIAEDYIRNTRTNPADQKKRWDWRQLKFVEYEEKGNVDTANRLKVFNESNLEGNKKNIELILLGDWIVDLGVIVDKIRMFTTEYRLSFNPITGVMNVVDEWTLAFIESTSGKYFTVQEYAEAEKEAAILGIKHVIQNYKVNPDDELNLLMKTFDFNDDYLESLREAGISNSTLERIMGTELKHLYMHLGEMHNHIVPGLAHLRHIKVTDKEGKEISLRDALEKFEYSVGNSTAYRFFIKDGCKIEVKSNRFKGGSKTFDFTRLASDEEIKKGGDAFRELALVTDEYFSIVTNSIREVNKRMNGAMSTTDRAPVQRLSIGRALMQFRGWLVAYMTNRFGNDFLDSNGEVRLAYWKVTSRFAFMLTKLFLTQAFRHWDEYKDLRNELWNNLSPLLKDCMKRALTELALLAIGLLATSYLAGDFIPDNDDMYEYDPSTGKRKKKNKKKKHPYDDTPWFAIGRFAYMISLRGTLEVNASVPTFSMIDSLVKIFLDPIPCIDNVSLMIKFINPSYISVHAGMQASKPLFGIEDDYLVLLLQYYKPQLRQYLNTKDLLESTTDAPYRWFESGN